VSGEETEAVWGWGQLVAGGFVEYVDTEEEETTLIAMTMKDLALQRDAVRRYCCLGSV
jgi:DNA-directed RNA polymerase II subunit RPB2